MIPINPGDFFPHFTHLYGPALPRTMEAGIIRHIPLGHFLVLVFFIFPLLCADPNLAFPSQRRTYWGTCVSRTLEDCERRTIPGRRFRNG